MIAASAPASSDPGGSGIVMSWTWPRSRISARRVTVTASGATPAPASISRPRASSSPRTLFTAAQSSSSRTPGRDRANSKLTGATRKPRADAAPEAGGTMTSRMPRMRATRAAWAGPAPPKATMAKRRGSHPFSTMWTRAAPAMLSDTSV